jgi:hypothetical protein
VTGLDQYLDRYISRSSAVGYQPAHDAQLLGGFVRYLDRSGQQKVTVAAALGGPTRPALPDSRPSGWPQCEALPAT